MGSDQLATITAGPPVLVVMAKPLVTGRVKTRLAAAIGADAALAVYRRLLAAAIAGAEQVAGVSPVLALASDPRTARSLPARGTRWTELEQRGETLGERLAAVFDDLFATGVEAVVAIDSDSPAIPAEYLRLSFERLGPGRIVLGPAADGGYYAVGIDRHTWESHAEPLRGLFTGAPMGTSSLLSWTLAAAVRGGLEAVQLPLWLDIDEAADLPVLERLSSREDVRGEAAVALGLREVYLHLTNRCGSACLHCYNRANLREPDELSTGEWCRVIDDCVTLGATSFVFLGGDPLLRDDLCELLEHVTGHHGLKARLFFNSPVTAALAARLAAAGHGRLRTLVSIDGPEKIHDGLRSPGNHAAAFASIANLLAAGLEPWPTRSCSGRPCPACPPWRVSSGAPGSRACT